MIKAKINKFYYKSLAPTPYSSLWLWQRSQLRKKNIKSFCFDHTQPSSDEEPLVNQAKKVSKIKVISMKMLLEEDDNESEQKKLFLALPFYQSIAILHFLCFANL